MSTTNISKLIHEQFHLSTSIQNRILNPNNFTYKTIIQIILKYTDKLSQKNILDIGCGSGTLSLYIASQPSYKITGIDIAENAIQACINSAKLLELSKNTSFEVKNFPSELPRKKFNAILCLEVIEHLKDDNKALREIYNLLKPGGILVLSTPSVNAPLHKLGLTKNFDTKVGHLRRYNPDDLIKKVKFNRFKILEVKKTEGIIRNFLFINPLAGKLIRFIKFFIVDFVTTIDNISLALFGESDIIIIAQKPDKKSSAKSIKKSKK